MRSCVGHGGHTAISVLLFAFVVGCYGAAVTGIVLCHFCQLGLVGIIVIPNPVWVWMLRSRCGFVGACLSVRGGGGESVCVDACVFVCVRASIPIHLLL